MNIKSTKQRELKITWEIFNNFPMDKLTFTFALVAGVLLGFATIGFGHTGPIIIALIVFVVVGGFGALDSGSDGFMYVLRLGIYSIIVANVLMLYPSTLIKYEKTPVVLVHTTETVNKVKKLAVQIYDKASNDKIRTKYYDTDKQELVDKLYANTKYIQHQIEYFPLIKYKRKMRFYDN